MGGAAEYSWMIDSRYNQPEHRIPSSAAPFLVAGGFLLFLEELQVVILKSLIPNEQFIKSKVSAYVKHKPQNLNAPVNVPIN